MILEAATLFLKVFFSQIFSRDIRSEKYLDDFWNSAESFGFLQRGLD
jgi:hypothetical protein